MVRGIGGLDATRPWNGTGGLDTTEAAENITHPDPIITAWE
jgi:hypothetical protein